MPLPRGYFADLAGQSKEILYQLSLASGAAAWNAFTGAPVVSFPGASTQFVGGTAISLRGGGQILYATGATGNIQLRVRMTQGGNDYFLATLPVSTIGDDNALASWFFDIEVSIRDTAVTDTKAFWPVGSLSLETETAGTFVTTACDDPGHSQNIITDGTTLDFQVDVKHQTNNNSVVYLEHLRAKVI